MDSTRQQKISKLLQKDLAEILQSMAQEHFRGIIISVTKVRVSPDLGYAKSFLSVFPSKEAPEILKSVREASKSIRLTLGKRVKNQLRVVPELEFFVDDSLDYEENIDRLLKGEGENPIS